MSRLKELEEEIKILKAALEIEIAKREALERGLRATPYGVAPARECHKNMDPASSLYYRMSVRGK